MKTFRDILLDSQHIACEVCEAEIRTLDNPLRSTMPTFKEMMRESIDRAYVLGELIDILPPKILDRTV